LLDKLANGNLIQIIKKKNKKGINVYFIRVKSIIYWHDVSEHSNIEEAYDEVKSIEQIIAESFNQK
jgi:hypothetical protein